MKRLTLTIAAVLAAPAALAAEPHPDFSAHLVGDPNAVGHLKFNYEPYPGMPFYLRSMDGAFLLDALAIGLGDRVELGFVPVLYASSFYSKDSVIDRNLTAKWNFYRSAELSVAVADMVTYTEFRLPKELPDGTRYHWSTDRARMYQNGLSLNGAAALTDHLTLGVGGSLSLTFTNMKELTVPLREQLFKTESFADLSYRVSPSLAATAGISRTERLLGGGQYGAGGTVTWYRPGCLLSAPAFGVHHLGAERRDVLLLSTTFY